MSYGVVEAGASAIQDGVMLEAPPTSAIYCGASSAPAILQRWAIVCAGRDLNNERILSAEGHHQDYYVQDFPTCGRGHAYVMAVPMPAEESGPYLVIDRHTLRLLRV